jgi:hypothetical protein
MKRLTPIVLAILCGLACASVRPKDPPLDIEAPPLPPGEQWFCCDSEGNCALATSACGPGEDLKWCNNVGEDPDTGLDVCLDE